MVISSTALTCPAFSAMSAMTAGSATRMAEVWNSGAWNVGSPIHAASATWERSTRSALTTCPGASWSGTRVAPKTRSNSHDTRKPNTSPSSTVIRPRKPRSSTVASTTNAMVSRPTHWS